MKSFTPLLLCVILAWPAEGQSLLEPGKRWMNLVMAASGGPPPYWMYTSTVEFAADTLINTHLYKRIRVSYDEQALSWVTIGFIRETDDHKVFGFPISTDTTERIIYDFTLTPGQQTEVHPPGCWFGEVQVAVVSVDSVFFAGGMHKRINLANESWIEGIGSDRGVIYGGLGVVVGVQYFLNCYHLNDTLLYHNPDWPLCYYDNTGDGQEILLTSPGIYPNPATATCTVETAILPATISFFDNTGRKIKHQTITDSPSRISLDLIREGMYYYLLETEDSMIMTGKLVISR